MALALQRVVPDPLAQADSPWLIEEVGGALASGRVLPAVASLLARAGVAMEALDVVAVARGPGAFTGLRTAVSVAQGLALGLGRPVLLLDSLMVVAEAARLQHAVGPDHLQWVAMDARMQEIYAASYRWAQGTLQGPSHGTWQTEHAPSLLRAEALSTLWRTPSASGAAPTAPTPAPIVATTALAGTAFAAAGAALAVPLAWRVEPGVTQRAAALASLAAQRWRVDAVVDAAEALPLYVRDKVAQTSAERAEIAERTQKAQHGATAA